MADASHSSAAYRDRIYRRLVRRNAVIDVLRVIVPAAGLVLFGILALQIYVGNIASEAGITGIRIERETLIIETPKYAGVMSTGTRYSVVAREARKPITGGDVVDLLDVSVEIVRPDGYVMRGSAALAHYDILAQTVLVPQLLSVNDSREVKALLHNSLIDWNAQTLRTEEDVVVDYPDGTRIEARSLFFDSVTTNWQFGPTVLTTPGGL